MSDRTAAQVRLYAIPDEHRAEAVALLDEELREESDGTQWVDYEVSCGMLDEEIVPRLMEWGATFEAWEDPAYEWLGTLYVHVPGLGLFARDCDTHGNPLWNGNEVAHLLTLPQDEQQRAVGQPWEAVIVPLRKAWQDAPVPA